MDSFNIINIVSCTVLHSITNQWLEVFMIISNGSMIVHQNLDGLVTN